MRYISLLLIILAVGCKKQGCTDPNSFNYDPEAVRDDGSCIPIIKGCTDPNSFNYTPDANVADSSCVFLRLDSPENADSLLGMGVHFSWTDRANTGNYHFLLSTYPHFASPLKDISLDSSNYLLTAPSLEPSTQYYWQITSGTESRTGTFFTQNPFKNIGNTYLATVRKTCWGAAGTCDTSYLDSIKVFWVGKKLQMEVNTLGLTTHLNYISDPYFSYGNTVYYAENLNYSQRRGLRLDYSSNRAVADYRSGGLGGAIEYTFEFFW